MNDQSKREQIQKEALASVLDYRRAGLHISMGVGKTYIGLQYIQRTYKSGKILVVAPKVSIFESWKNDAVKFNLESILEAITFTTYISLVKHNPQDYEIVILDEAHNTKESHDLFLHAFRGRVLGLTGTPPKYKFGEKGQMMSNYYPIKYSYTVDDAVDESILNDYKIFIHTLPLSNQNNLLVGSKAKKFYTSEANNYNWLLSQMDQAYSEKDKFMKRIMVLNAIKQFTTKVDFVKTVMNKIPETEKCLVFANTTEQADLICNYSYHSKNSKVLNQELLNKFSTGEIKRLSAVEQLSEGINIPNLKQILIMHSYGNEKKASQKIGRALRLNRDEVASVHILCYRNTIDETWVSNALEDFDESKIKWVDWILKNGQFTKL